MNTENETRDIGPHHCDGHFVLMHDRGYGGEGRAYYPLHSVLKGDDLHLKGRAVCSCGYEQDFEMTIPLPAGCEPDLNTLSLSHMKGHPLTLSFKDGHGMSQRISGPVFDLPERADEDMKALTVAGDYAPPHQTQDCTARRPHHRRGFVGIEGTGKHDIQGTVWVRARTTKDAPVVALNGMQAKYEVHASGGLWFRHGYLNDYDGVGGLADIVWLACTKRPRRLRHHHEPHEPQVRASQEEIEAKIFERDGRLRAKGYTVEVVA